MFCFSLSSVIVLCCFGLIHGDGQFWFVTDFHVDQNYSRTGNPLKLCHEDSTVFPDVGFYGNFLCDSPLSLLTATVKSMQEINSNPDFVIWTGDSLPHTEIVNAEWGTVFEDIKNISLILLSAFPNTPIFPSIGNHDTFPPNILFPNASSDGIYDRYLNEGGWGKFLSKNATSTFVQGGYYSEVIKPGLRLISLNTILWYTPNEYTKEMSDPANQFKWLKEVLQKSFLSAEKIYIIGHVPPGYYNRVNPGEKSDPMYHLHFFKMYLELLHQYSEIILGQMYGHLHMDFFQLFQFNTGVFKSSSIIASSVSPWHYIDKYNVSVPVNPSIRLMHYSKSNFSLLDYDQFFMNLTKANNMNQTSLIKNNLYEHLYKFTHFYNVPDLSTESLCQVYEMLKKNDSVYKDFYKFLTAAKQTTTCGKYCKIAQLCSMSAVSSDEYDKCMNTISKTYLLHKTYINTSVVLTITITLSIFVFLAVFIIYRRYWKSNFSSSKLEYVPYMNLQ